jgi:hypothetical protein
MGKGDLSISVGKSPPGRRKPKKTGTMIWP